LVPDFEVIPAHIDETRFSSEDPADLARQIAVAKARLIASTHPGALIISGDTLVVVDGTVLGKPSDEADAIRMLTLLSNRSHTVVTGVCLILNDREDSFVESTTVKFRRLSDQEIEDYVAMGDPMDKAGAYAIQGGAGRFVEKFEGSYSNVVGLPVETLAIKLAEFRSEA
jgi:septum formation protein